VGLHAAVIILSIGSEDWPFPVPIVQSKDRVQEVSAENQRIVGQDEAIHAIVSAYQMYLAGTNSPGRPIGNFLFLGPTGSGKTTRASGR
jgi:ATP-dependent Clp protease ATP-binding subunit ClpA